MRRLRPAAVLHRRIRREIRENFLQFLAVILIAFLAVTLFCGLTANYKKLERRVDDVYTRGNMPDVFVLTTGLEKADPADSGTEDAQPAWNDPAFAAALPGVEATESRLYLNADSGGSSVVLTVTEGRPTLSVPITEAEGSVLCDSHLLFRIGAEVGKPFPLTLSLDFSALLEKAGLPAEFVLSLLDGMLAEGGTNVLRQGEITLQVIVDGTMLHPEAISASSTAAGLLTMTQEDFFGFLRPVIEQNFTAAGATLILDNLKNVNLSNELLLTVADGQEESVMTALRDYFGEKETSNLLMVFDRESSPGNAVIESDIRQARMLTYVFPVIFFLVSVLVISTTITQLINREHTAIGTLKGLGFSKRAILRHYMGYGVVLCLLGGVLGVIVGPLLIPSIMDIKNNLLYQLPDLLPPFAFLEYGACLLLLVGVAALVSFLVCRKEIALRPAESMRPVAPKTARTTRLERSRTFARWPLSLRMAWRNIVRQKGRALMVILGVAGCTALLVCGFGIDNTLDNSVYTETEVLFPAELNLTLANPETLPTLEGVRFEAYARQSGQLQSELGVRDATLLVFSPDTEMFGGGTLSDEGGLLSESLAQKLGVGPGDTLTVLCGGKTAEIPVAGLFRSGFTQALVLTPAQGDLLGLTAGYAYGKITDPALTQAEAAEQLRTLESVQSVTTTEDTLRTAEDILATVRIITATVKVFAILLAVVVLYNLSLLNFRERFRDIATLKVLGIPNGQIAASLIWESMALTLLGTLIGLPLGYPVMVLMLSINQTEMLTFLYLLLPVSYLISAAITLLTSFAVNVLLGRRVRKVRMIESLKSVE